MIKSIINKCLGVACMAVIFTACTIPTLVNKSVNTKTPERYNSVMDTTNTAQVQWKDYFTDPYLNALIDTALSNNQELNIMLQEMQIARNEVRAKKGEYLPSVGIGASAGVDKVGRYTRNGAVESNLEIDEGKEFPEPLSDLMVGAYANWEVDIWKKLRNAKKSAMMRYLSSVEGKNFMVTNLIAEIANSYYELLALDNELDNVQKNIQILNDALKIVKLQKDAARITELAVKRFEAEVLKNKSRQYYIKQEIIEIENEINFLVGRYPQPVERDSDNFIDLVPQSIQAGVPAQLLENRPDIRQAEMELAAAKLDVKVAKARFYPSLGISAGVGFQAFSPSYFAKTPESLLYSLAGDVMAPLINRNAIKADYMSANAAQIQAVYEYEQALLNAYIEVMNQLSMISNLNSSYNLKAQQVEALNQSITISTTLFRSARADYMEVLLTQREALEAKFELIETKMQQMHAFVNMYQALGGGWH